MPDEVTETGIYDPYEVELQQLNALGAGDIQLDFTNPQAARFLAQQSTVRLFELRAQRAALQRLQREVDALRDQREQLRVDNGRLQEREHISWIEFPAGILCGIAGNLLTTRADNFFAWGLLVLGLSLFIVVRLSQIAGIFRRKGLRGE
jgi:FtsZ-binding cell division protein ZapB